MIRAALTEHLHHWGLACEAVDNLEDALTAARNNPPALTISKQAKLIHNRAG